MKRSSIFLILSLFGLLFLFAGCKENRCERTTCSDSFTFTDPMEECCFYHEPSSVVIEHFNPVSFDLNRDGSNDITFKRGTLSTYGYNGASAIFVKTEYKTEYITTGNGLPVTVAFRFGDDFIPDLYTWGSGSAYLAVREWQNGGYSSHNFFNSGDDSPGILVVRMPLDNGEYAYGFVVLKVNATDSTISASISGWGGEKES